MVGLMFIVVGFFLKKEGLSIEMVCTVDEIEESVGELL